MMMHRAAVNPRKPRSAGAWLFVYALFALCAVLGIQQYRAIVELSIAARERLESGLEANLMALSQDFNSEISSAARALAPNGVQDAATAQSVFTSRYPHGIERLLFSRVAMAVPEKAGVNLLMFDPEHGAWKPTEWPVEWNGLRDRFEHSPPSENHPEDRRPPVEERRPPVARNDGPAFEIPLFRESHGPPPGAGPMTGQGPGPGRGRGGPHGHRPPGGPPPEARPEVAWLIFEINLGYARDTLLPELIERHLGADYQAEVVTRTPPRQVLYRSDPDAARDLEKTADASVSLFDPQAEGMARRAGAPGVRGAMRGPGPNSGRGGSIEGGRWLIFVRHRAGSLEAAVSQARRRSIAVTAGVLLMLAATLAALIRYTRRAQRLAELQMEFVAGVSHELRTPLTVIHTAAHNLRGKVAANPSQVERYGALILQESRRLEDLVEQVLRFAGANAGHAIRERQTLAVESLIDEAIAAARPVTENAGCVVEKRVAADLPALWGDPVALRHALQNLLSNAAKYGAGESRWIGVGASKAGSAGRPAVEIRVADRGPGIPAGEQKQIFDPFFRGARAVEDQVHGTGLGLSLVRKIVEAHGGTLSVNSKPGAGAEFIVALPAVSPNPDGAANDAPSPAGHSGAEA